MNARLFKELITLRSKCFSAIMDEMRVCPNLSKRALHQLELVDALYSDDSFLLTLSAQMLFCLGESAFALEKTLKALEIDPTNESAKYTQEFIVDCLPRAGWKQMSEGAVLLIQHAMNSASTQEDLDLETLNRAIALVKQSLDAEENQALGWAALGWLSLIKKLPAEAIACIEQAVALDPEGDEPFVHAMIEDVKKRLYPVIMDD